MAFQIDAMLVPLILQLKEVVHMFRFYWYMSSPPSYGRRPLVANVRDIQQIWIAWYFTVNQSGAISRKNLHVWNIHQSCLVVLWFVNKIGGLCLQWWGGGSWIHAQQLDLISNNYVIFLPVILPTGGGQKTACALYGPLPLRDINLTLPLFNVYNLFKHNYVWPILNSLMKCLFLSCV